MTNEVIEVNDVTFLLSLQRCIGELKSSYVSYKADNTIELYIMRVSTLRFGNVSASFGMMRGAFEHNRLTCSFFSYATRCHTHNSVTTDLPNRCLLVARSHLWHTHKRTLKIQQLSRLLTFRHAVVTKRCHTAAIRTPQLILNSISSRLVQILISGT